MEKIEKKQETEIVSGKEKDKNEALKEEIEIVEKDENEALKEEIEIVEKDKNEALEEEIEIPFSADYALKELAMRYRKAVGRETARLVLRMMHDAYACAHPNPADVSDSSESDESTDSECDPEPVLFDDVYEELLKSLRHQLGRGEIYNLLNYVLRATNIEEDLELACYDVRTRLSKKRERFARTPYERLYNNVQFPFLLNKLNNQPRW